MVIKDRTLLDSWFLVPNQKTYGGPGGLSLLNSEKVQKGSGLGTGPRADKNHPSFSYMTIVKSVRFYFKKEISAISILKSQK